MSSQTIETPTDRASLVKLLAGTSVQVGDLVELKMDSALANAVLHVLDAAGLVVVPKVPTAEMMDAGLHQASHDASWSDVYSSYVDMIAKAASLSSPST